MFLTALSLLTNVLLISADICIPTTRHRRTVDLRLVAKRSFYESGGYFRSMVYDEKYNRLIVGSRNALYFLNDTSLEVLSKRGWNIQKNSNSCMKTTNNNTRLCGNYIQFLSIFDNKLVVCGTNSLSPRLKILSLENTTKTLKEKNDFNGCASPYPDHPMVGSLTDLGEIIAAMYTDTSKNKSEIVGSYVMDSTRDPSPSLTTSVSNSNSEFANPDFITSIYVNDTVYLFVMEDAVELNNTRAATVARLCQADNGGPAYLERKMWVTYRKARINCRVKNGEDNFEYKYLVSFTYDESKQLFYGAFTMSRSERLSSAICTYTRKQFDKAFDGDFLSHNSETGGWIRKSSGNFLNGCSVNRDKLQNNPPIKAGDGKIFTDSLNIESITIALSERLMSQTILSDQNLLQYNMAGERFSKLICEVITTTSHGDLTVLYVATETGSIYLLYEIPKQNKICKIEELVTKLKDIKNLLLVKKKRLLYISTDDEVLKLKLDVCERYGSKEECVYAHNPFCGWSDSSKQCVPTSKSNDSLNFFQDLTKCSEQKDFWNTWSTWKACSSGSKESYCLCRQRICQSCNESLCANGESVQVTNCSITPIVDYKLWLLVGSSNGSWSSWGNWSICNNGKCGNKTMTRYRSCTSPSPNGGQQCEGDSFQCKSCTEMLDLCDLIWSSWSSWGDCLEVKKTIYLRSRSRMCSRPVGCPGNSTEHTHCSPDGWIWGEWSTCSCQRIRHRLPVFIAGCGDDCLQLHIAYYEKCEPDIKCPGTTPVVTRTTSATTEQYTKNLPTTVNKFSTISDTTSTMGNDVESHTSKQLNPNINNQAIKTNEHKIQFKLRDLVMIACAIILSCFLVCTCIIVLILRQKKGKFNVSYEVDELQSPQLIRNKSIGNGIDMLEDDDDDTGKTPMHDTELPLIKATKL